MLRARPAGGRAGFRRGHGHGVDGDTRAGVLYTTIASMNDEIVTPYTQQALSGPDVTNIVLQDHYPD